MDSLPRFNINDQLEGVPHAEDLVEPEGVDEVETPLRFAQWMSKRQHSVNCVNARASTTNPSSPHVISKEVEKGHRLIKIIYTDDITDRTESLVHDICKNICIYLCIVLIHNRYFK